MGASYYAYTVIGCEVTDKIRTKKVVGEGCAHNNYQPFCPTCGKPRRVEAWTDAPGYDHDRREITHAGSTLKVVTTTDDKRLFAGVMVEVKSWKDEDDGALALFIQTGLDDEEAVSKRPTMRMIVDRVRNILRPLGLWDEHTFAVWCVQHCSY